MFSKTRQLLRGMSVPFKLAWLLLVAGMILFIGGMLPLDWPTAWAGIGCLMVGSFVTGLLPRDRDDPRSTDGAFRGGVFVSMLLNATVLPLVFGALIGVCALIIGLFAGFPFTLLTVSLRMLAIALVYSFVTGIPAYATLPSRERPAS
ncbi:hypothetical protein [Haloferula sp. A504]|uniref:hypothetical protein n=1 Tax=Haloferula sp. A504 TaxID=3373601 RepID=UPI0031C69FF2|nr:hypothetical protein [Verrucomicrobiaceae bacterium E54]